MKRPERWIDGRGYVRLKRPKRTHPGGFVYEHRLVMEQLLGRALLRTEDVHHRNHIRSDNRPENLVLTTRGPHTAHHNRIAPKRKKGQRSTRADEPTPFQRYCLAVLNGEEAPTFSPTLGTRTKKRRRSPHAATPPLPTT